MILTCSRLINVSLWQINLLRFVFVIKPFKYLMIRKICLRYLPYLPGIAIKLLFGWIGLFKSILTLLRLSDKWKRFLVTVSEPRGVGGWWVVGARHPRPIMKQIRKQAMRLIILGRNIVIFTWGVSDNVLAARICLTERINFDQD